MRASLNNQHAHTQSSKPTSPVPTSSLDALAVHSHGQGTSLSKSTSNIISVSVGSRTDTLARLIGRKSLNSLATGGMIRLNHSQSEGSMASSSTTTSLYLSLKHRINESDLIAHSVNDKDVFPPLPKAPYEVFHPYVPPAIAAVSSAKSPRAETVPTSRNSTSVHSSRAPIVFDNEGDEFISAQPSPVVVSNGPGVVTSSSSFRAPTVTPSIEINDSVPVTPLTSARRTSFNAHMLTSTVGSGWDKRIEDHLQDIASVSSEVMDDELSTNNIGVAAQHSTESQEAETPLTNLHSRSGSQTLFEHPTAKIYSRAGRVTQGLFGKHDDDFSDIEKKLLKEQENQQQPNLVPDYEAIMKQVRPCLLPLVNVCFVVFIYCCLLLLVLCRVMWLSYERYLEKGTRRSHAGLSMLLLAAYRLISR